jgi:hypothetical protein
MVNTPSPGADTACNPCVPPLLAIAIAFHFSRYHLVSEGSGRPVVRKPETYRCALRSAPHFTDKYVLGSGDGSGQFDPNTFALSGNFFGFQFTNRDGDNRTFGVHANNVTRTNYDWGAAGSDDVEG